jgi:RNA polymerase sigma-70 factor (ECF subfamily)
MRPAPAVGEVSASHLNAFTEAQAAWPAISLPADVFLSYLLARSEGTHPRDLQVADLYLACACGRGDRKALEEFDRCCLAPIEPLIARSSRASAPPGEILQLTRQHLLVGDALQPPRITEYAGRGALTAWVKVVAVRMALHFTRDDRVEGGQSRLSQVMPSPLNPEEEIIQARYGEAFKRSFRSAFGDLDAEDRLILRLHFAEGLNLNRLGVAMNFSRATAGRRLQAARTALRDGTLKAMAAQMNTSEEEVQQVLAILRSRLEISMSVLVSEA